MMSYLVPLVKAIYLLLTLAITVWIGFVFGFYGVFFAGLFENATAGGFFFILMLIICAFAPATIVIFTHSEWLAFLNWAAPKWSEWLPFYETMHDWAERSPRRRSRLFPGWGSCCEGVKATFIMTFANWTTIFVWLPFLVVESQVQKSLYYQSSYAAQKLIAERSGGIVLGIIATWIFIAFCLYRVDYQLHQWAIARKAKAQSKSQAAPADPIDVELEQIRDRVRRESSQVVRAAKPKSGKKRRRSPSSPKQRRQGKKPKPADETDKAIDNLLEKIDRDDFDSIFK